jgi:predicted nucleic acid-binding protein
MTTDGIGVDNDIIFKAACYRLTSVFWPPSEGATRVGVLGAARYVIGSLLDEASLSGSTDDARSDLELFLARAETLEPEADEAALAAEMELAAQRLGAELDTGESQLAAMAIIRSFERLQTGDKRAIGAIERLLDHIPVLAALEGRLVCLEQVVSACAEVSLEELAEAVCAEPDVDKALTFCFACTSPEAAAVDSAREGLASYINDVRSRAPRVLAP